MDEKKKLAVMAFIDHNFERFFGAGGVGIQEVTMMLAIEGAEMPEEDLYQVLRECGYSWNGSGWIGGDSL